MKRFAVPALVVLVVGLTGALGYVMGDSSDDGTTDADCIMQVPVSDHVEGQCIPEARPLLGFFDEPSTPPGATAEGWRQVGELWLDEHNPYLDSDAPTRLCWVNETDETRCSS